MKGKKWNNEETNFLKENYSTLPTSIISKKINKSVSAIQAKAYTLGIKSNGIKANSRWWENYEAYSSGLKGQKLNLWVRDNRKGYKNNTLPEHKIELLKKINFDFKKPSDTWNENWEIRFNKYKSGIKNDKEIYWWTSYNRTNYQMGKLSADRIEKLKSIGFDFEKIRIRKVPIKKNK